MDCVPKAKLIVSQTRQLVRALRLNREALRAERQRARRLAAEARSLRRSTPHDLVPLYLAVLRIFRRVYEDRAQMGSAPRPTAYLDGLTYTIAEYVPIYRYSEDGTCLKPLGKQELAGGLFENGAKALTYIDGRPAIRELAVSARAVDGIAVALIAAGNQAWNFAPYRGPPAG